MVGKNTWWIDRKAVVLDCVLLAAGESRRFGKNKLMHPFRGQPLYRHMVDRMSTLQGLGLIDRFVLVTQPGKISEEVRARSDLQVVVVENANPERGIAHSLTLGLAKVLERDPDSTGCLFAVCDQPYLSQDVLEEMIIKFQQGKKEILVCGCGEIQGNPVIFSRQFYPELLQLQGKQGGKQVVSQHLSQVEVFPVPSYVLMDTDYPLYGLGANPEAPLLPLDWAQAFPFLQRKNLVLTLVGAGGKTTLLYHLAEQFASRGCHTLVATSTKIFRPPPEQWAKNRQEVESRWNAGNFAVVGKEAPEGKLECLPEEERNIFWKMADVVLIEGDGAKRMPCKAPAPWEPVILPETEVVVAVVGLSALGEPLNQGCFRWEYAKKLLQKSGEEEITWKDLVVLLTHAAGNTTKMEQREFFAVVNQWDGIGEEGRKMLQELKAQGVKGILATLSPLEN